MSTAIRWFEKAEFDAPALNSPQPCIHGAGCVFTVKGPEGAVLPGCCRFVHPGEEGTGRRLFPARTVEGTGSTQPACVRLVGNAGFYERRRLKMPWQAWCELKGIPFTPNVPGVLREPVKRTPIGGRLATPSKPTTSEKAAPLSAVPVGGEVWPVLGGPTAVLGSHGLTGWREEEEGSSAEQGRSAEQGSSAEEESKAEESGSLAEQRPPLCYECKKTRAWGGICVDCHMAKHSQLVYERGDWRMPDIHNIRQGYWMEQSYYAQMRRKNA
jgi:hypothetical protein